MFEAGQGQLHRRPPKTAAGVRWVPVNREIATMLAELGAGRDADEPLFTTQSGAPLRISNFRTRQWDPANERAGLDYEIHELRHTRMSTWASAGVRPEQIRDWGGYSDIGTVYRVYVHGDPKPGSADVAQIPSLLSE